MLSFLLILSVFNGLLLCEISAEDDINYLTHLSRNILPQKYALSILVDLDAIVFSGNVTTNLQILEPTITFKLHSKDLTVLWEELQLRDGNNKEYKVDTYYIDDYQETVQLNFTETLPVGEYLMSISFSAAIRSDLTGLYRSSYKRNGETVYEIIFNFI